ncbi:hypothetical protein HOB87_10555 [Candidatus Woesearchaeota archaeon]|jgi:hypothetical protein|nr:hypothetical protein [Candidatus Woesearchaeota archaeon]
MKEYLIKTLKNLKNEFQQDELAFLALTTKIELPFRDRWSFLLYKELIQKSIYSSREWNRTDIALIQDNKPLVLIELKAMYSFDSIRKTKSGIHGDEQFLRAMANDVKKAIKLSNKNTDIYTVLLVTHPHNSIGIDHPANTAVKYRNYINKSFKNKTQEEIKGFVEARLENKLNKIGNIVYFDTIKGGNAFGVDMSIMYWLVKCNI